jgi:hypothetical protein
MVFQLGPWGKVLVLAFGGGVVMITLIIVVCFVGPGCWGYEWMHRGKNNYRNPNGTLNLLDIEIAVQ